MDILSVSYRKDWNDYLQCWQRYTLTIEIIILERES